MKCPVCKAWVECIESRPKPNSTRYRRYECGNGHRFTTIEQVARILKGNPALLKHLDKQEAK